MNISNLHNKINGLPMKKKKIKIGDKMFEFDSPNILNKSTTDMMNDWCRLIEQQKSNEDVVFGR